jgi:hypothetical protein
MKTTPTSCVYAAIVALTLAGLNHAVEAAPSYIGGTISFKGGASLDAPMGSATAITSFSNITVVADTNGIYGPLENSQAASWAPFTFAPPGTPVSPLWSCTSNGIAYSFNATSMSVVFSGTNFLDIQGTGIAHITGYADTPGTWVIGVQQFNSAVSFSATTTISPTNVPTIYSYRMTNGNLGMSWNALVGQPYQLQTCTNLGQTIWSNATGVITATNPTATASYPVGSEDGRYFRVVVLPQ